MKMTILYQDLEAHSSYHDQQLVHEWVACRKSICITEQEIAINLIALN